MLNYILILLSTILVNAFFFFLGWQFSKLVPIWVQRREREKERRKEEQLKSMLYYVNHLYRRV